MVVVLFFLRQPTASVVMYVNFKLAGADPERVRIFFLTGASPVADQPPFRTKLRKFQNALPVNMFKRVIELTIPVAQLT